LYRHALVTVPDNSLVQPPWVPQPVTSATAYDQSNPPNYLYTEVSATGDQTKPGQIYFNSPRDLTMPARRVGMDPANPAGYPQVVRGVGPTYPLYSDMPAGNANLKAADLLLTDVVSFDVRVLVDRPTVTGGVNRPDFEDLYQLTNPTRPVGVYFLSN